MSDAVDLAKRAVEEGLVDFGLLMEADRPPAPPRYELGPLLGRGGGGTVYRATDLDLGRPVALKYLSDASPAELERFRREARFAARLNDPAIVQVYELGAVEGFAYIAMQYVDGLNLRDAELPLADLLNAACSIARALARAHQVGIVHRDIKPENILLDRAGHAYLTDFGIARDVSGRLAETISREGMILGTAPLMSPEQARGQQQAVDARSDVYSLGATLYCKLAGRYPFVGQGIVDVLHAVLHAEPPLLRAVAPDVPRALEAIVMKCLEKPRHARYQSMEELARELERFLAGACGEGDKSPWFRRRVARMPSAPPRADSEQSLEDTRFRVGLEIARELAAWDADLYRVSGSLERSFARLDGLRARLDVELEASPDAAWARFYRGLAWFRAGRLDLALEDMERSIDRVRNLAGAYFELGRLYLALYLEEHHAARQHISPTGVGFSLDAARKRLDQARVAFGEARRLDGELAPWHEGYAEAVTRLADADFEGCIGACDAILEREPDLEEVWKLRGDAEGLAGRDPFASYARAAEVRRSYYQAFHAMGEAHVERGLYAEARATLERAIEIHPGHAPSRALLAEIFLRAYPDDAEALRAGESLAQVTRQLDPESYAAAIVLARLRLSLARAEAEERWIDRAEEALSAAETLAGCQNRVGYLQTQSRLQRGELRHACGTGARELLDGVLSRCDEALACDPGSTHWAALRARAAELAGRETPRVALRPDGGTAYHGTRDRGALDRS